MSRGGRRARLLRARGALVLHGPPHTRATTASSSADREHRAGSTCSALLTPDELCARRPAHCSTALNALWQGVMNWQTSEAVWMQRQLIVEEPDRACAEVSARASAFGPRTT